MTPRAELSTIRLDDMQSPWPNFDVIQAEDGERIIGVFEKGFDGMQPLSDRWLITRDTGIPELLDLFVKTRQRAYLVYSRNEVVGIVTPADLNKLPARAYIYNLIGELEMGLAHLIKQECASDPEILFRSLSRDRSAELEKFQADLEKGNAGVEIVEFLYLAELIGILQKLDLNSRQEAKKIFSGVNELRIQTMHLVRPLLTKIPEDLDTLHGRLKRINEILERLSNINNTRL